MTNHWRHPRTRRQPIGGALPADARRQQLLAVALPLAEQHGFEHVNRTMIGEAAGCSPSLLSQYWTAQELQTAIMEEAVRIGCLPVVAQGLAAKHPVALGASPALRQQAAASLA
jgi:AcrR family transcriptional regulator